MSGLTKGLDRRPTAKSYSMVKDWLLSPRTGVLPGCPHMPLLIASMLKAVRQEQDKERHQTGLSYRKSEGNTHTLRSYKQGQQDGMV